MTRFTTSKGDFIAVPVPFNGWAPGSYKNKCWLCEELFIGDKLARMCLSCAVHVTDIDFEIIGLSSDILKDEELAKSIVEASKGWFNQYLNYNIPSQDKWLWSAKDSFDSLTAFHKIEGNQLIIKKK